MDIPNYNYAPAVLLYQTIGQHYEQCRVRIWYINPVFPGLYFYALSKD